MRFGKIMPTSPNRVLHYIRIITIQDTFEVIQHKPNSKPLYAHSQYFLRAHLSQEFCTLLHSSGSFSQVKPVLQSCMLHTSYGPAAATYYWLLIQTFVHVCRQQQDKDQNVFNFNHLFNATSLLLKANLSKLQHNAQVKIISVNRNTKFMAKRVLLFPPTCIIFQQTLFSNF